MKYLEIKCKKMLIRSRANIVGNGKKKQSFFVIWKHTSIYTAKTIKFLEQENEVLKTNKEDILKKTANIMKICIQVKTIIFVTLIWIHI